MRVRVLKPEMQAMVSQKLILLQRYSLEKSNTFLANKTPCNWIQLAGEGGGGWGGRASAPPPPHPTHTHTHTHTPFWKLKELCFYSPHSESLVSPPNLPLTFKVAPRSLARHFEREAWRLQLVTIVEAVDKLAEKYNYCTVKDTEKRTLPDC